MHAVVREVPVAPEELGGLLELSTQLWLSLNFLHLVSAVLQVVVFPLLFSEIPLPGHLPLPFSMSSLHILLGHEH